MDPRYMDICKLDTLSIARLHKKKSCEIKVGPDLLRLVSLLGLDKSKVGGGGGRTV